MFTPWRTTTRPAASVMNLPACESEAARAPAGKTAAATNARLAANRRIFSNYYVRSPSFPVMPRVLVVDDEPAVRRALERALKLDSYEVELAADGEEALDRLVQSDIDAVVLDISMPRLDGLEVCRRMRTAGDRTPVLMLTARDAVDDRVEGLDVGADDYLVKPFALRELQARLRALLRRAGDGVGGEVLRYGDLVLDPIAHEVRRGERVVELSKTEFSLLELFMQHPRQVLSRSAIFEHVWGYDFGPTSNALGVYMGYLRRKTEEGGEPRLLHTIRGVGYVLKED
jgi:two-component system response regulator MprA